MPRIAPLMAALALAWTAGLALSPAPAAARETAKPAAAPLHASLTTPAAKAQARTAAVYAELLARDPARASELALFLTELPKGGDLHHHYTGAIYAETYLDWVKALDYCIYKADAPELQVQKLRIETRPFASLPPANQALCLKAPQVSADPVLYRSLLSTWSDKDYGNHFHLQPPPDQQFFNTFGYFGPASAYSVNEGLKGLKARALSENVQYLETMLKGAPTPDLGALAPSIDQLNSQSRPEDVTRALEQAFAWLEGQQAAQAQVQQYVQSLDVAAKGVEDEGFTLRFQTYISRNSSPSRSFAGLYAGFKAAQLSPWLAGVNIVGPENGEVAMRDYVLHMRMIQFLKARWPATRLSLHAGELAVGMVPPEGLRHHIRDAVEIAGANRIGHGIDIPHERDAAGLLRHMAAKGLPVEVNLTSNEFILGVKGADHPLPLYRRFGVPFVISTDDAGVSRSTLSQEYLLYVTRYRPSYAELKATVYRSIRHAFLAPEVQARELKKLDQAFATFEQKISQWPLSQDRR